MNATSGPFSSVRNMLIDVLGPLRVRRGDEAIRIPQGRAAAATCWLAANVGERVSFSGLAEVLWPDVPPGASAKATRVLRSLVPLLGDALTFHNGAAILDLPPEAVDAVRFERLVAEIATVGSTRPAEIRVERLQEALRMWRGEAYVELERAVPAIGLLDRLTGQRVAVEQELGALALAGQVDYADVARLRSLTITYPREPRLRHQLAQALYRTGRQIEALEELSQMRTIGLDDAATAALGAAILRQEERLYQEEFR